MKKTQLLLAFCLLSFQALHAQIDSIYTPTKYIHTSSKFSIEQAFAQISSIDSATFYAEDVNWDLKTKDNLDAVFIDEKLKAVDALDYLRKIIATHQIIIINECHNLPQHRLLINELLKLMPAHSIYAYENLIDTATQLSKDKTPLVVQKGYTSNQSQMAEIFRTAKRRGIEIFQYENVNEKCYDTIYKWGKPMCFNKCDPNSMECVVDSDLYKLIQANYRDYVQGFNLRNKISANPGKKILIHCGYGHAFKSPGDMAEFITMCSGYKLYVVDQTTFNSHQHPELDLTMYNANIDSSIKEPVVLVAGNDTAVQLRKTQQNLVDLYVFYPRYEKKQGRFTNIICDECRLIHLNTDSFGAKQFPILIKAYYQDEYKKYGMNAVPADVFEVADKTDSCSAVLRKGEYIYLINPTSGGAITQRISVP